MSPIEPGAPFDETDLAEIEGRLKRPLPEAYRQFAREYGGAFVGGSLDGDDEYEVLAFETADHIRQSFELLPEYPESGMLIFAGCSLGGIYVINHDDTIWYRVVHSGKVTALQVASAFEEFLGRIVIYPDDT